MSERVSQNPNDQRAAINRLRKRQAGITGAALLMTLSAACSTSLDPGKIASSQAKLPAAARAQEVSDVQIATVLANGNTVSGSGVLVMYKGRVRALTAGHVVAGTNCKDNQVMVKTGSTTSKAWAPDSRAIIEVGHGNNLSTDFAMLTLPSDAPLPADAMPQSVIPASYPDEFGVAAMSENFEPTAKGQVRDPVITGPAIFDGTIIANPNGNGNGKYVMADGVGMSYGKVWDNRIREGASGSPVSVGKTVIGLATGMVLEVLSDKRTTDRLPPGFINDHYNLDVPPNPNTSDGSYSAALIQPLDTALLDEALAQTQSCK